MEDRERLRQVVSQAITEVFDDALTQLRIAVSALSALLDAEDADKLRLKQSKIEEAYELIRKRILRTGNNKIREMAALLEDYEVYYHEPRIDEVMFEGKE